MRTTKGLRPTVPVVADEAIADAGGSSANVLAELGTDDVKWANAFMANVINSGKPVTADWVAAWFANAIMAGHDAAVAKGGKYTTLDVEQAVRDALADPTVIEAVAIRNAILNPAVWAPQMLRDLVIQLKAEGYANGQADLSEAVTVYAKLKDFNSGVVGPLTDDDHERIGVAVDHFSFTPLTNLENVMLVHPASVAAFALANQDNGNAAALASIPTLPHPDEIPEWDKRIPDILRIDPNHWIAWRDLFKSQGVADHLRAGLNSDADHPTLSVAEVNALDMFVAENGNVTITVDGRGRFDALGANIVIVRTPTDRYVVRSHGATDKPSPTDTVADRVGDQDNTSDR